MANLNLAGWFGLRLEPVFANDTASPRNLATFTKVKPKFLKHTFIAVILFQVVVSGQLNYSDPRVQNELEDLLSSLENTTYIDPIYTESW